MSCGSCAAKAVLNNSGIESQDVELGCGKLNAYDWMQDLPNSIDESSLVEVKFKNTRKEFFINENELSLKRGDYVAVSVAKGHDIGQVSLTGKMALLQIERKKPKNKPEQIIYRKATPADLEKWQKSKLREKSVMIEARKIAESLKLSMKISDVEFQADGTKATFFYIAEGRVDFRELIKEYARKFGIRVEMRQIGARQEAAMVGGIGSCGKELCCSSWRSNLDSVSGNAAKIQELPHNIQKLTGQCGKLKCCLMYELDHYIEAQNDFPDLLLELETDNGIAYPRKKEVLKKVVWYTVGKEPGSPLIPLSLKRVKEIIMLNKKGIKVPGLKDDELTLKDEPEYQTFENDLAILEKTKKQKKKRPNFKGKKRRFKNGKKVQAKNTSKE